jgi:hypothetical protein
MLSAFGVDHGEVSKAAFKLPYVATRAGRAARSARATARASAPPAGPGPGTKLKDALSRAGEANISLKGIGAGAGKGTKAVGGFLEKRPGLTGTALVGGGGAAGYKVLSDKQPKKKKRF